MWTKIEEQIYVKEKGEALNTTINSPKDLDDLEAKSSKTLNVGEGDPNRLRSSLTSQT